LAVHFEILFTSQHLAKFG